MLCVSCSISGKESVKSCAAGLCCGWGFTNAVRAERRGAQLLHISLFPLGFAIAALRVRGVLNADQLLQFSYWFKKSTHCAYRLAGCMVGVSFAITMLACVLDASFICSSTETALFHLWLVTLVCMLLQLHLHELQSGSAYHLPSIAVVWCQCGTALLFTESVHIASCCASDASIAATPAQYTRGCAAGAASLGLC